MKITHKKLFMVVTAVAVLPLLGFVSNTRAADAPAPPPPPSPSLEQRVAGLEAYLTNGDPTAPLKDKDGNIPKGLATPSVGTSGPGHNAWQMTSSVTGW